MPDPVHRVAGHQCHPQAASGESGPAPGPANANTAIEAAYVPAGTDLEAPLLAEARGGTPGSSTSFRPADAGDETGGPAVKLKFDAPVAAPNASTAYVVELRPREVAGCATPAVIVSQPSSHDIAAGQQVQMTVPLESTLRHELLRSRVPRPLLERRR